MAWVARFRQQHVPAEPTRFRTRLSGTGGRAGPSARLLPSHAAQGRRRTSAAAPTMSSRRPRTRVRQREQIHDPIAGVSDDDDWGAVRLPETCPPFERRQPGNPLEIRFQREESAPRRADEGAFVARRVDRRGQRRH